MKKRLAKGQKRQVSRSREKIAISEPDVRTSGQVAADRQASRSVLHRDQNRWPSLPGDAGASAALPSMPTCGPTGLEGTR